MNYMKLKTGIILIITLLIGVLIGALADRTITKKIYKQRFSKMRNADGLFFMLDHIIEPDELQEKALREILNKRSKQIHEIFTKSHLQVEAIMDSLNNDLEPILTEEQKERLNRRIERFREFKRKRPPFGRRGRRHPMKKDDDFPPPPPFPPEFR